MEDPVEQQKTAEHQETMAENQLIRAFDSVRFNIREGQKQKGKLTLQDCKILIGAEKILSDFLRKLVLQSSDDKGKEDENEKVIATDEIYAAYRVVLTCLEILQSTGIYSIEGSVDLLGWMEEIAVSLDKVKDPAIRMRELKEKTKSSKKKKDK